MNVGNENAGTATSNLELSLGYSKQCVSSRSSDQGAGANATIATSRVGMAYVVSEPLSELVWSPHNGLSLKCAECSFIAKPPPLIWDAGPSEYPDEGKMVTSQASLLVTPRSVRGTLPLAEPNFGHFAGKSGDVDNMNNIGKELAANANRKEITSTSVLPLDRLECTAENELPLEKSADCKSDETLVRSKSVRIETSPAFNKTLLKGKAKVSSEGDASKTTSKEEKNSSESVESCGSVRLFSGGEKRGRFEPQQLILGSKRVKNHIQESTVSSPSLVGQHSSFMNWISNMVNGLNRIDQDEDEFSLALTLAKPKEGHVTEDNKIVSYKGNHHRQGGNDMGFGTIFRSIYRPEEIGESKEVMATPVSCHGDLACADMADGINFSSSETHAEDNNKCDDPGSLWISRFSTKSHEHLVNLDRPSLKVNNNSNEILSNYNLPIQNKRAITSVCAKKIDALNNIMPSEVTRDKFRKTETCFYCGKIGHDLRNCLEIAEVDGDNFVKNMSTYERMKMSHSCLCIKCFQVGHWAISCLKESTVKTESPSQVMGTSNAVNSIAGNDVAKGEKLASSGNSDDGKLLEVPKGMFDAIRKLRLSRMDLHKWMNSRSSLGSLDGYFLRLRLGKWEKSQGGSGYYVACINGERKGKQPQGSKRLMSVEIEGKSCLVESRYISNQDFVEEELTAWWFTTVKSGGSIPSGNDMKVKFEERKRLGF